MRLPPTLPYYALLVIGSVGALTPTAAESQEFALQVFPTSVEIPYGGEATVLVVLQNTGAALLDAAHVSTFSNPPLQVKIEPTESRPVPAHGIITWTAHVSTGKLKAASGSVYFRVDFTRQAKEGEPPTPALPVIAVASSTITSQTLQSLADVIEVKTESTIESLNSKRPGILYLSLKNKTNVPITVGKATVKSPAWVQVNAEGSPMPKASPNLGATTSEAMKKELVLEPYASRMLAYNVTADVRVTPGKQLLVFEVPLSWEKGGLTQQATAIASQQVDVGVFGESAILAALGVPTFLFLPGFLIITTIGVLWKLGKPESEKDKFPLKGNTTDFYLLSITLSILVFIAYPWITSLRGVRRDLTEAYGLEDVVRVWFGCVFVGLLAVGAYTGCQAIARYRRSLCEFSTSDDASAFLQKLGRKHMGIRFQKAPIGSPPNTEDAFVIADVPSQDGKSWVAPAIVMTWKPDSGEEQQAVVDAINSNDAAEVSRLLSAARTLVTLGFQPPGTTKAVRMIDKTTIGTRGSAQKIIS
jgi:hypothetical protein